MIELPMEIRGGKICGFDRSRFRDLVAARRDGHYTLTLKEHRDRSPSTLKAIWGWSEHIARHCADSGIDKEDVLCSAMQMVGMVEERCVFGEYRWVRKSLAQGGEMDDGDFIKIMAALQKIAHDYVEHCLPLPTNYPDLPPLDWQKIMNK